nr:ephrin-A2 [Zonotrichia albicollis]
MEILGAWQAWEEDGRTRRVAEALTWDGNGNGNGEGLGSRRVCDPLPQHLRRFHRGDYTVEVSINDYLDIYCPHYEEPLPERMERYILYMVNYEGHASCDHRQLCRFPLNPPPLSPFPPAAASPPNTVDRPCLKLKVYVRPTNDSLYESPEPIFTSNNSCCSLRLRILPSLGAPSSVLPRRP